MEKLNFKYLYSFKYKDKEYIYLYSKNYPFYFLEYNSNNFDYPDIDIFKEISDKFNSKDNILAIDIKKAREVLSKISINVKPLVKTKKGLITLALALSLCGCSKTEEIPTENKEIVTTSESKDKNKEISEYFKKYDMDVINKEYSNIDYIFTIDFINKENKHQITIDNFDEFRKIKNIDFIPTWDDVINAFKNNENIDEEKKNIILESIDNMKNSEDLKGIDLSVLYANAKRMKFKYVSTEDMINEVNRQSVYAYFNTVDGIVYLPNDKDFRKFEFIHEVLGHGTLAYREELEDKEIVFDCTNIIMLPNDDNYTGYTIGTMVSEGGANMIAHIATNDYSVSTFYELYEEELRVISKLCNVSLGELFNHKGISLYDLMYKNNINTPVEYIFKMDGIMKGQLYCDYSDLMDRLFIDATEENIINSKDNQEELIKDTIEIIKNSNFKDKKELHFDYDGGSINYNFDESANRYEESINKLIGK